MRVWLLSPHGCAVLVIVARNNGDDVKLDICHAKLLSNKTIAHRDWSPVLLDVSKPVSNFPLPPPNRVRQLVSHVPQDGGLPLKI